MPPEKQQNSNDYDDSKPIKYLEPREHVRKRPGMYIGGTNKPALHHMVWEVLDDAIIEFGHEKTGEITISLQADKTVTVSDNGIGLPTNIFDDGTYWLESYFTKAIGFAARGRERLIQNETGLHISGGLHGIGVSAINALSSFCHVEVKHEGYLWRQSYSEGATTSPLEQVRPLEDGEGTGTSITFRPDFTIMEENDFDFDLIAKRCEELAFLLPNLKFVLEDKRENFQTIAFYYPEGLLAWLKETAQAKTPLTEAFSSQHESKYTTSWDNPYTVIVQVAFQWLDSEESLVKGFVNTIETEQGGTHLEALEASLAKELGIEWEKLKRGFVATLHILHPDPQFESQKLIRLLNQDVFAAVDEAIKTLFAANPEMKTGVQAELGDKIMQEQANQNSSDWYEDGIGRKGSKNSIADTMREHMRLRPGMYIGGVDKCALHHMVWEVVDNSIEDAMLSKCSQIEITLLQNQTVRVDDNGEGLTTSSPNDNETRSIAELIMTDTYHKSSFDGKYYGVSGGLHGMGLFIVNSLSESCLLEVWRDGFLWRQSYYEGLASSPLEKVRALEDGETTGTRITFRPNFMILDENEFDFELISKRCDDLAYLEPNLQITVTDKREMERQKIYKHPQGLVDWVTTQTKGKVTVGEILSRHVIETITRANGEEYQIGLGIAFQYVESQDGIERSYINSVPIAEGGSHLEALKETFIKQLKTDDIKIGKRNVMKGLVVIINLKHPDPQFGSPTKITLINRDVKKVIRKAIRAIFAANPEAKASIQAKFR